MLFQVAFQLPLEYFLMGVVFQKEVFQATQFHHEKQGELLKVCDYWPFVHFDHFYRNKQYSQDSETTRTRTGSGLGLPGETAGRWL